MQCLRHPLHAYEDTRQERGALQGKSLCALIWTSLSDRLPYSWVWSAQALPLHVLFNQCKFTI